MFSKKKLHSGFFELFLQEIFLYRNPIEMSWYGLLKKIYHGKTSLSTIGSVDQTTVKAFLEFQIAYILDRYSWSIDRQSYQWREYFSNYSLCF